MTAQVVQLSPSRDRQWPLLVPRSLFTHYQATIGIEATLVWLNLYELADTDEPGGFASVQGELAARMGIDAEVVEYAATVLEKTGLLERQEGRWTIRWPEQTSPRRKTKEPPVQPWDPPEPQEQSFVESADGEPGWNTDEAALQAVVQFYHQRIGMLGPSQFERLRFWVEDQGMSSDVVALAIEETVQSAQTPRMNYVEGVLRNWYNDGIRTLADLQKSKRVRSQEVLPTTEGSPNAGSFDAVDRDAVRRWREMYSDEYDN